MQRLFPLFAVVLLLVLVPTRDAHAYLDPGTGSLIIQLVVAGVLGAVFTIKMWIGSAKRFVRRLVGAEAKGAPVARAGEGGDPAAQG